MSQKFERLVSLLRDLFQLDQPDLDFGLYRIMHAKSAEVTQFLERDLLPQVRKAFEQYQPADKAEREKELKELLAGIQKAGMNPDDSPEIRRRRAEIANSVDIGGLEDEVFDHLHSFFRRYYSEGDFLSKRVYKQGVYAVPYEGEEVVLHWANKDQYYIKTSEYLRDYAFRLRPESEASPMRVHFRLADAAEGEHGNIKATEGKDRVFVLAPAGDSGHDFVQVEKVNGQDELVIRFVYRPATIDDWTEEAKRSATVAAAAKPPTQRVLSAIATKAVFGARERAFAPWIAELQQTHTKVNGDKAEYSRLEGHLARYTARHTFDYFIHKDLGRFLRSELDFYIKNEVMHLDDVQSESVPRVEQYLSKIKVLRAIAGKIIAFLTQLEDFQARLWSMKPFVLQTTWLVRLGFIPVELRPEIVANAKQIDAWSALTGLSPSEITGALEDHPGLMVDTAHFEAPFADRLLATIQDLDTLTDVVVMHGENYRSLNLVQAGYSGAVKCIYIDPPYNTGQDGFAYKDNFKSSSWASMIHDRLDLAARLLSSNGILFSSINEIERGTLEWQLREVFGASNRVEELIWIRDTVSNNAPLYSTNHEYIEVFAHSRAAIESDPRMLRERREGFTEVCALIGELGPRFASIEEIEAAIKELYQQHRAEHLASAVERGEDPEEAKRSDPWKGLYPYKWAEYRDSVGKPVPEGEAKARNAEIWVFREVEPSMPAGKQAASIRDPKSENFRFYTPPHPEFGLPCKPPKRGWAFPERANAKRPSFESYCADDRLVFKDPGTIPQLKYFLHEVETVVSTSVVRHYADGEPQLEALFGEKGLIDNPKPPALVATLVKQTTFGAEIVLDFFAGSGTTGHAVINLNRSDGARRRCVLMEMAHYFDSVLVPRIQKVTYSPLWENGKPTRAATPEEIDRSPRVVKRVRVQSYEDALSNLLIKRSTQQADLLSRPGNGSLAEQFTLRYMLPTESRGSPSLLNIERFTDPNAYVMLARRGGTDETHGLNVDLVETFVWLLGLKVANVAAPHAFSAEFDRNEEGQLRLKGGRGGRLRLDPKGKWWFRTVTGKSRDGKRTLVIWRKRPGGDTPEGIEQDNLVLDEWFRKQGYSTSDAEFDLIYVNGDNNLGNLRQEDESQEGLNETGWKVRVIEEDFHRLMFDTEDAR